MNENKKVIMNENKKVIVNENDKVKQQVWID